MIMWDWMFCISSTLKEREDIAEKNSLRHYCRCEDTWTLRCIRQSVGLDTLEEPPEQRGIDHIRRHHRTRTAGNHATESPTRRRPSTIMEPKSPGSEKNWLHAVVVNYPPLHGGLVDRHVREVTANDEEGNRERWRRCHSRDRWWCQWHCQLLTTDKHFSPSACHMSKGHITNAEIDAQWKSHLAISNSLKITPGHF